MKLAMLYEKLPDDQVRCDLCAHQCRISENGMGICQVRENCGGELYTHCYGSVIAQSVDPIEKKPLFHFFPGSRTYSIAAPGCNFRCSWCQNWEVSQLPRQQGSVVGRQRSPEEIVDDAEKLACQSVAYTYTEPTIFFEYALDVARLADARGIHNVMVTNGYMTEDMLQAFHPYLDAVNVDLKSFRDDTYRKYIGARLDPVLDNLKSMRRHGFWVEVTSLVIPGINDDPAELRDVAEFLVSELGPQTPWHISRFFPAHQLGDVPPTPVSTLRLAHRIGREAGLRYVYLGNVGNQSTYCHKCERVAISRSATHVLDDQLDRSGRCRLCGTAVAGVGMGGAQAVTSSTGPGT